MTKVSGFNPTVQRITQLRNEVVYSLLEGNYKQYKTAVKENAKMTLQNYELVKEVKSPSLNDIPIFSKLGIRMLGILFLDFFRIKTPEEKRLKAMKQANVFNKNKVY